MRTITGYTLVYQAGIANVFKGRKRVLQHSFSNCETFCHGLIEAGAKVKTAWCNQAGDIAGSDWRFDNFDLAPWSEQFKFKS